MKAEKLMIGDLVIATEYVYDENTDDEKYIEHYARVTDISPAAHLWIDNYECSVMIDWLDDCDAEMFYGDLSPIPLTEEILRANGFENIIGYEFYYSTLLLRQSGIVVTINSEMVVTNWTDHNENNFVEFSCAFVHELQHALRLCGLTELADNFKIK